MRIDHIVWYSADLAEARRSFAQGLGQEPLYGGEHPGEGTANALLSLGPSAYLEILGRDPEQHEAALDPEVKALQGSGIYHWAVGGVDLAAVAARAEAAGLTGGALVPGGRVKPDGERISWVCWGLHGHRFGSLIPFFIDWGDTRHPAQAAPRGGELSQFEIRTPEAAALSEIFRILGIDVPVVEREEAKVVARLRSGAGEMTLTSFAPMPRGYVI